MSDVVPVERAWDVHGLHLTAQCWGDPESPPVLALHGWLDNAASFAPLAACLADAFYVVALDLSGHGQSGWRSADATYQVYDDLPQIRGIIEQLGWSKFALIGHSRGAIIGTLFAATFPELVSRLILLDGIVPSPLEPAGFVDQMRNFVIEKERLLNRQYRIFESEQQAVMVREEQGLNRASAQLIAMRNLRACEGGFTWSTDPRLRGASAVKMTTEQIDVVLAAVTTPTLLMAAEQGLAGKHPEVFQSLEERMPDIKLEQVPGGHHFHMENGVVTLAQRLQRFLLGRG
ncbi:alpha/beta fold hydrolase [Pseudohalioglobus lutimaris]|uniref:Alpha/beta hydrolase n=1 Tax=Pseudohalioglobus lutimaris TaxID=1737061 RepID=A0A2N5X2T8_9GAMM|nr:alpha/beta hydrolase [Pseudohalioglobus lutimaris]PLW68802.1 alpha/beta hydrolase [Pseudohalioglobus lutimaris]